MAGIIQWPGSWQVASGLNELLIGENDSNKNHFREMNAKMAMGISTWVSNWNFSICRSQRLAVEVTVVCRQAYDGMRFATTCSSALRVNGCQAETESPLRPWHGWTRYSDQALSLCQNCSLTGTFSTQWTYIEHLTYLIPVLFLFLNLISIISRVHCWRHAWHANREVSATRSHQFPRFPASRMIRCQSR